MKQKYVIVENGSYQEAFVSTPCGSKEEAVQEWVGYMNVGGEPDIDGAELKIIELGSVPSVRIDIQRAVKLTPWVPIVDNLPHRKVIAKKTTKKVNKKKK